MRIESEIPHKTIRDFIEKHAHMIEAISWESGFCGGWGYDVLLKPGFATHDCMHTIVGGGARWTMSELRTVGPCDCSICQEELGGRN